MIGMGIAERRERERDRRRREILEAAWLVAEREGWAAFSMERVAAQAELGRATLYGYFDSLEDLVEAMAEQALALLGERVASTPGLAEALDAPVRFAQAHPAAFSLLFRDAHEARPDFASEGIEEARREASLVVGNLRRLASRAGATLPEDARSAEAFLAGISLAGAVVPDLRTSTPLRRKWQAFCLALPPSMPELGEVPEGAAAAGDHPAASARVPVSPKRRG
jgi:AcrR family transcriptional regulator